MVPESWCWGTRKNNPDFLPVMLHALLDCLIVLPVTCSENDCPVRSSVMPDAWAFFTFLCGLKSCFTQGKVVSSLAILHRNFAAHLKILLQATVIIHSFLKIHIWAKKRPPSPLAKGLTLYYCKHRLKTCQPGKVRIFSIFIVRNKKAVLPETNHLEKAPASNPFSSPPSMFSFSYHCPKYGNLQKMPLAIAGSFDAKPPTVIQADV